MNQRPSPEDFGKRESSARQASQGEIILRTRLRKLVFCGGLAGVVLISILLAFTA